MVVKEQFEILISKDGQLKMTVQGIRKRGCEKTLLRLKQLIAPDLPIIEQGKTWEHDLIEEDTSESLKVLKPPKKDE